MDTTLSSSPDDEGEQAQATRFLSQSFFILFFSSCYYTANPKSEVTLQPTVFKEPFAEQPLAPPVKKKKTIYITFDDGPNKGTRQVLKVVNEEALPVSFFVVGEHVYGSREQSSMWDSMQQCPYAEIYNHSYTHANHNHFAMYYQNDSTVVKDFEKCNDSLHLETKIARTPGRNIWRTPTVTKTDIAKSKEAADSLYQNGFTVVGWDLEWFYSSDSLKLKQSSEELFQQVDSILVNNKTKTPGHIVLLTHDQAFADSTDASALQKFIQLVKKKDEYAVEFVSKYPGIKQ